MLLVRPICVHKSGLDLLCAIGPLLSCRLHCRAEDRRAWQGSCDPTGMGEECKVGGPEKDQNPTAECEMADRDAFVPQEHEQLTDRLVAKDIGEGHDSSDSSPPVPRWS